MKKWMISFLCLAFLLALPFPSGAVSPKIIDKADLLSEAEEAALEQKAQQLVDTYHMDVVILTVWSLDDKTAEAYADDYFDHNGYGIGSDYSGILFLLSMEYRDWHMSTSGDTVYAITDYGVQSIFEEIAWYLSEDQYYFAFNAYLDQLSDYFSAYAQDDPIDGYKDAYDGPGSYYPGTYEDIVYYDKPTEADFVLPLLISLLIGAAVGGIAILIMRGQMNTAVAQSGARSYLKSGSYRLFQQQDVFLYQKVTKVRRAESNSSGGGSRGGGGSRVHRSSSGRSHGGGGGKF